ncbi:DUF397 domain-containing protein [Kibdelosporangium persicum]|uniref:DUF397 domain-containing protein n=1 Tax=Kibdelosporangium persicum TaxID=2698649 RepID=UPI001563EF65|nr:DUF397 domain-containing protein [Kibdelosporangium persicum]
MRNATWFKSSRCGEGPTCVEVALLDRRIGIRDAKNPRPVLVVRPACWRLFRRFVG